MGMDALSETDRLAFRDDVVALRRTTKSAAAGAVIGALSCSSVFQDVQRRVEALCQPFDSTLADAVDSSVHLELLSLLTPQSNEGDDGLLQFIENLRQPLGTAAGTIDAKAICSGVACLATLIRLCGASVSPKLSQQCYQSAFATFLSLSRLNKYAEAQAECLALIITLLDVAALQQTTRASTDALQWLPASVINVDRLVDVVLRVADRNTTPGQRLKSMALQLLGKLCERFGVEMAEHSQKVLNVFIQVGNRMAEKRTPEQIVGEGLLVGLAAYMSAFSLDFLARDRSTIFTIHQLLKSALLFAENASSYRFTRAALHFIELHAPTLQECLFNDYKDMFGILERLWCHSNTDLHRAAYPAATAFFQAVAQYANYLIATSTRTSELGESAVPEAPPANDNDSKARAVVMDILRSTESTVLSRTAFNRQQQRSEAESDAPHIVRRESLAYAIVAIGAMAPSIRVVSGEAEVHRFLQLLCAKCEYLLSPANGSVEEVVRLLPHFITAFANTFLQMEQEPQECASAMSSILNATLTLYPQRYFFERSRKATVHALTLLFVSLRPHPDLYYGILVPFVRKSVMLAGSTSSIFAPAVLQDENVAVDGEEEAFNLTFVKLWDGLLVGDVSIQRWGFPWSTVCDGTEVDELRSVLRTELALAIVDILQRLDLRLHAKQTDEDDLVQRRRSADAEELAIVDGQDTDRGDGGSKSEVNLCAVMTLGEDHVAPASSRDYALVLNLVPFVVGCMESLIVLEEAGVVEEVVMYSTDTHKTDRTSHVANIFVDALVALLRRFPFVSGFYTCLGALFRAVSQQESRLATDATLVWTQASMAIRHLVVTAGRLMVLYTDDLLLQCAVCITEIPLTAHSVAHPHNVPKSVEGVETDANEDECDIETTGEIGSHSQSRKADMTRAHAMQIVLQAAVDAPVVYDRALAVLESWLVDDSDGAARHVMPLVFGVARTRPDVSPKLCRLLGRYGLRSRCQMESGGTVAASEDAETTLNGEAMSIRGWTQSMKMLENEKLRIPFGKSTLLFPLGALLPRVAEIAVISQDRKVRVAAAEEMHAITLWAIGTKNDKWYRPLFDYVVRLSSSHDRVVEELFSSLLMQCAHWFAKQPEGGGSHLLDAVMVGVTSPGDGRLRRIASNALIELLRWALPMPAGTLHTGDTPVSESKMVSRVFESVTHVLHRAALCDRLGGAVAVSKILHVIGTEQPAVVAAYVPRLVVGVLAAMGHAADSAASHDDSSGVVDQVLTVVSQLRRFIHRHRRLVRTENGGGQTISLAAILPTIFERTRDESLHSRARVAAQDLFMCVLLNRAESEGNLSPQELLQQRHIAVDWDGSVPAFESQPNNTTPGKSWLSNDLSRTLAATEFFLWVRSMKLKDASALFSPKRERSDVGETASVKTPLWLTVCTALRNFVSWSDAQKAYSAQNVSVTDAYLVLSVVDILPRIVETVVGKEARDLQAAGLSTAAAQALRDALSLKSVVPVAMRLLLHPHVLNLPSWETERIQRCGSILLTAVMGKLFGGTAASPWDDESGTDPLLSTHLLSACIQLLPRSITVRRASLQSVFAVRPPHAQALFHGLCALSDLGHWSAVVQHLEKVSGTHDEPLAEYLLREAFSGHMNQTFVHSDPRVVPFLRSACRLALATEGASVKTVLGAARDANEASAIAVQGRLSTRSMSCVSETDNWTPKRETAISCVATFQNQIVPFVAQHVEELVDLCHVEMVDVLATEEEEGQQSANARQRRFDGLACTMLFKLLQFGGATAGGVVRLNSGVGAREARRDQTDAQLGEDLARHVHKIIHLRENLSRASSVRALVLNCFIYDRCFALNPQAATQYLLAELAIDVMKMAVDTQWLYSEHTLLGGRDALRLLQCAASLLRRVSTVDGWEKCAVPSAEGTGTIGLSVRVAEVVRRIVHDELPLDYETELSTGSVEMDNFPLVINALGNLVVCVAPACPAVILELAPLMVNPQQRYSHVLMESVDEALRRLKPDVMVALIDEAASLLSSVGPINLWRTVLYRVLLRAIRRLPPHEIVEYYKLKIASFVALVERAAMGFAAMREQTLAFILMETMYRTVDSEVIKGDINAAYARSKEAGCVPSGKELTIALIKHCSSCVRGSGAVSTVSTLAFDAVHEPLWHRQAAYCCLAAALMATQDQVQVFARILLSSPSSGGGGGGGGMIGPGDFVGRITDASCAYAFEEETTFPQVSLQSALSRDPWEVAMNSQLSYTARKLGVRQRDGVGNGTGAASDGTTNDPNGGFSFFSIPNPPEMAWLDDSALEMTAINADAYGFDDEQGGSPNRGLRALSRAATRYFDGLEDNEDTRTTDVLRTFSSSELLGGRRQTSNARSERTTQTRTTPRSLALPRELAETVADLDSVWLSCCTGAVLELLDFLALKFGVAAGGWPVQIAAALAAPDIVVPLSAKFVLARLVALRPNYFTCIANQLFIPLVDIAMASETLSAVPGTLNYVARETFVTLLGWSESGNLEFPANATQRMIDCIVRTVHSDSTHTCGENVELLNRVWRNAKTKATLNLTAIASLMGSENHSRVRTGVQVCGIITDSAMSLMSQDVRPDAAEKLYSYLTSLLHKDKDLYQECAEVVGMELQQTRGIMNNNNNNNTAAQESLSSMVRRSLLVLLSNRGTGPFLRALRLIATHDTTLLSDFIPEAIFRDFVVLSSMEQMTVLETIGLGVAQTAVAAYSTLHAQFCGRLDAVADIVRVAFYTLLERMLPYLPLETTDQMCAAFLTQQNLSLLHNSVDGRLAFYQLCVRVFVRTAASPESLDRIADMVRTGLRDPSAFVQDVALDFLDKSGLPVDPAERFLELIVHGCARSVDSDDKQNAEHASNVEDPWLRHTSILLLSICHRNAAFADDRTVVFSSPLATCEFADKTVSLETQALRPQHTPLFTQHGGDQARVSSTQKQQQQQQQQSSATALKSALFTPTTQGNFTLYSTSVPATPSQSKLTFTRLRDLVPPPTKTLAEQLSATSGADGQRIWGNGNAESLAPPQMRSLPRRLKKLPEQLKVRLSLMNSVRVAQNRRRVLDDEAARRRRSVVLFSQYREGDIPDIQIPLKAFVVPLQALCLYDVTVARVAMNAISKHFFSEAVKMQSPTDSSTLSVSGVLTSSTPLNPSSPSMPFFAHSANEISSCDTVQSQQRLTVTPHQVRAELTRFAAAVITSSSISHARAVIQFSHELVCMQLLNKQFSQDIPTYDLPVNAMLRDRELSQIPSTPLLMEPKLSGMANGSLVALSAEQTQAWMTYYFLLRLRSETDLALASARHFMAHGASVRLSRAADMSQSGAYQIAERFLQNELSNAHGSSAPLTASERLVLEHERRVALAAMLKWDDVHASLTSQGISLNQSAVQDAVWADVAQFVHASVHAAPDRIRNEFLAFPKAANMFPVERSVLLLGKEDTLEACVDESSRALCRLLANEGNVWSSFGLLRRVHELAFIADAADLLLSARRHAEFAAVRFSGTAAQFGNSPSPVRTEPMRQRTYCGEEKILGIRNSLPARAMRHLASLAHATPDRTSEVWEVVLMCFEKVAHQLLVWNQAEEDYDPMQGTSLSQLAAAANEQFQALSITAVDTLYAVRETNASCPYILSQCGPCSPGAQRGSESTPDEKEDVIRRTRRHNDRNIASIQTQVYNAAFEAAYTANPIRDTFGLLKTKLQDSLASCGELLHPTRKTRAQQDHLMCYARALLQNESVSLRNTQDFITIADDLSALIGSVGKRGSTAYAPSTHTLAASALHLAQIVDVLDTIVASAMADKLSAAEVGTVWLHLAQSLTRLIDIHAGSGGGGGSNTTAVSERLLRLLQVYEAGIPDFSDAAWEEVRRNIVALPVGVWVPWCTQLLSVFLRVPHRDLAAIIVKVSKRYPQSMFYPYNCALEEVDELQSLTKKNAELSGEQKSSAEAILRTLGGLNRNLRQSRALENVKAFSEQLYRLHEPQFRFKSWMELVWKDVKKFQTSKDKNFYIRAQNNFMTCCKDCCCPHLVPDKERINKEFACAMEPHTKRFVDNGHLIDQPDVLSTRIREVLKEMPKPSSTGDLDVCEYSLPLANMFMGVGDELTVSTRSAVDGTDGTSSTQARRSLAVTGARIILPTTGELYRHGRTSLEAPLYITGIDSKLSVLSSLQRPKRIVLYTNATPRHFLAKGGDDLRLDQRVLEVFNVVNAMLRRHQTASQTAQLTIRTYSVVPVSKLAGLVEWVGNTDVLSRVIDGEFPRGKGTLHHASSLEYVKFYPSAEFYLPNYKKYPNTNNAHTLRMKNWIDAIYPFYLRDGLMACGVDYASFYRIRERFIATMAPLSISSYILGIGDRHLGNHLVDLSTGEIVGIDYGHAFGSATILLAAPELMPFRFTPQMQAVCGPLKSDAIHGPMTRTLHVMRRNRGTLEALVAAFAQEPLVQWQSSSGDTRAAKETAMKKVRTVTSKLNLEDPCGLYIKDVSENVSVRRMGVFNEVKCAIRGDPSPRGPVESPLTRPTNNESEARFVETLISIATDMNLLGRTYSGWQPLF